MYLLLLYFPLMSFLIIGLFGRYLGSHGSRFISVLNMGFTLIISYFIFYETVLKGSIVTLHLFS